MRSLMFVLALLVPTSSALASPHYHPPSPPVHPPAHPPPTQHRPPVINRPPVQPQQQILQQRQLQRGATQRGAMSAASLSLASIDDKVGDWGDFATLSEAELAALFKEMGIGDTQFDTSTIKNLMLAEMAGSGAPPDVVQQLAAQLDGMLGMLQGTIGASMSSFPTDMAREFKQIYSANCCGKAQFIAALGAAETKLANAFRNEFSNSLVGLAAQGGAPSSQVAALRGAMLGGTTVITYDAGDAAVIAASNMVANGRGGGTNVASNNNPPGGRNNAPPAPPATNTGGGTQQTPPAPPANPTPGTPPVGPPTNSVPTTPVTGTPQVPPQQPVVNPGGQTPPAPLVNPTPVTPPPGLPTNSVPTLPVLGTPQMPPQQPAVNPDSQTPPGPPGQQPTGLLTLVVPPADPEPVSLVPGGINPPASDPLDPSGLLDLTPSQDTPPISPDGSLPDPTDTQSVGPTTLDQVTSYRPPAEDPPSPCTTPECIQKDLDALALERDILDFERRMEPFIQTLDTLGNIGTAVGGIGCATLNPACAALPLGIAFKGLKVLIGGAKDSKIAGMQGADQYERLGTFVSSSTEGAAVEIVKEGLGFGVSKVAGGLVGKEAMESFGGAVFDAGTGAVIDVGADVAEGELNLKQLPNDVTRVYTGGGT